jgi:hypothetical protein
MVALDAVWYNFIRIHKTIRCTPAMETGVTDDFSRLTIWSKSWTDGKRARKPKERPARRVFAGPHTDWIRGANPVSNPPITNCRPSVQRLVSTKLARQRPPDPAEEKILAVAEPKLQFEGPWLLKAPVL